MKINTGGVSHIELSFETKKAILPQGVFSNVIDKTPENSKVELTWNSIPEWSRVKLQSLSTPWN